MGTVKLPRMFVLLIFAALLGAACGVAFSAPKRNRTLFQSLSVTGELRTGQPLTAALAYQQYLPIEIDVRCEVRQSKKLIKPIGQMKVPAYPNGSPTVTPFPGNISYDFTIDKAGDYFVECYTPSDKDNAIRYPFSVD